MGLSMKAHVTAGHRWMVDLGLLRPGKPRPADGAA
jgi:hypothetical protein